MEFKEYLAIIRRRWLLFFPIFVLIVGAHLVWVAYGQANLYQATSQIILGSDATGSTKQLSIPIQSVDLNLLTKEATLTHRPVVERAARLALGEIPFTSMSFQEEPFRGGIERGCIEVQAAFGTGETAVRDLVEYLRRNIAVTTHSEREIAELTVRASTESLAMMLSWAYAEGARQFHDELAADTVRRAENTLEKHMQEAEAELTRATAELAEVRERNQVPNLSLKEQLLEESLNRYEAQEADLEAQARTIDKQIATRLRQQSTAGRWDIDAARLATNENLDRIRSVLFETRLDYETLRSTLSPKHPDLVRLRGKIQGLEMAMAEEQGNLLTEQYEEFSRETNELIQEQSNIGLVREVYEEQQARLRKKIEALQELRKEYRPKEAAYASARGRIEQLAEVQKEVRWFADSRQGAVLIYDPAQEASAVSNPGGGFGPLTLTFLMAFIFSLGVVYIVEYVDTRMKNEQDVRRHLNLPLLGIIPKETERGRLLTEAPPQSEIAEKFNTAATLIQSISSDLGLRSLMVCSAVAREGKTTVSINLSIALARKGFRVALVDGDLRISQVHNLLHVSNHVGLSTAIDSRVSAQQLIDGVMTADELAGRQINPVGLMQRTGIEKLDVLPSGPPVADPVVLLEPARLARLVAELKKEYDFVVFDTPPINKVGDALTISSAVDGSIFVVGAGQAEQQEVTWAKHLLTNVQSNVLGVFLNKYSKQKSSEYYYYYYANDKKRKRIKTRA